MSVDFELPQGTKSYNLYKLHPPFRKSVDGHGYKGVILERESDGKLQCHICGEWFENLSNHVFYFHKIERNEYKRKFGLRKKDSLVCKKISERKKEIGKSPINISMLKEISRNGIEIRKANKEQHKNVVSKASLQSKNTLAALNEKGICPDQVDYRFDIVAEQLGEHPTVHKLRELDEPVYTRIIQKFGTYNKYIEYRKLNPRKSLKLDRIPNAKIIASIRNIYLKKGRVTARDFHSGNNSPAWSTIHERFGSLGNALREAGIDPSTWTMVG